MIRTLMLPLSRGTKAVLKAVLQVEEQTGFRLDTESKRSQGKIERRTKWSRHILEVKKSTLALNPGCTDLSQD